ncbi:pseudouridine synthase [Niastella sp. OAS944]|uniref:pseudouridine synthase n=1 Tax=Niastella sp. OAS944 TaxID=2664089 RepID=UPI0034847634|nr:23S rRNA pseudouridine2605 synthase [Chitinophagaceae bacterium OAS944]
MAQGFKKFMGKGDSGAKKKERIRQEKKKIRKETNEYFEKKKQEAREARAQGQAGGFQSQRGRDEHAGKRAESRGAEAKRPQGKEAPKQRGNEKATSFKPQAASNTAKGPKPNTGKAQKAGTQQQTTNHKPQTAKSGTQPETGNQKPATGVMPLNKFIAHGGICSRRDAVELVKAGKVIVNGQKILEPGHKVSDKDDIKVNGKKLFIRRNLVYILLNKPKDFLTTTEDPQGRKTVMDIIKNATEERVYPIGRLDRNTTGVLLLTNDGELAQKLSHPSYEIKKIYEVKLDKPLIKKDFDTILNGITLEDGFVSPDSLAYADSKDKSVIGIEIHSGRNRIVRRIFEHMGYDVRNLDRVMYANLTKKNVDRGKWRFLTEKEVRLLKYLNASYTKNKTVTRG